MFILELTVEGSNSPVQSDVKKVSLSSSLNIGQQEQLQGITQTIGNLRREDSGDNENSQQGIRLILKEMATAREERSKEMQRQEAARKEAAEIEAREEHAREEEARKVAAETRTHEKSAE